MIKIRVIKPFSYAYHGYKVVHYAPGLHQVSTRCAEIALACGWAVTDAKRKTKSKKNRKKARK